MLQQPATSVKLTNVSIIKYKTHGIQFQLAAYKNKVMEYRNGLEKNLDEVLQIDNVFLNVSKGQVAPDDKLRKAFGDKMSKNEIILEILKKGDVQISEGERKDEHERLNREIIELVSQRIVNPQTKRQYTPSILQKALADLKFNPSLHKSAKSQALEAIKLIVASDKLPAARAKMRVRILCPKKAREKILPYIEVQDEEQGAQWECEGLIDPGAFRQLGDLLQQETKGRGSIEVVDTAVIIQTDEKL